jgi:hypothetical protein
MINRNSKKSMEVGTFRKVVAERENDLRGDL